MPCKERCIFAPIGGDVSLKIVFCQIIPAGGDYACVACQLTHLSPGIYALCSHDRVPAATGSQDCSVFCDVDAKDILFREFALDIVIAAVRHLHDVSYGTNARC